MACRLSSLLLIAALGAPPALVAQIRNAPPNATAAQGLPPGWIGLFEGSGHCRYAVPPVWTIDDRDSRNAFATARDGSVVLHQSWIPVTSWSTFVTNALRSLQPTRTVTNSADTLSIEYPIGESDFQRYIALRTVGGACVTTIDVKPFARADDLSDASQIAGTVGIAR